MNNREQAVFSAIDNGDWDSAIEHASRIPANHDIWQRLPSYKPMPDHAIHSILSILTHPWKQQKSNLGSFIFELTHNLPETIMPDTINQIGEVIGMHSPGSQLESRKLLEHPNFKRDEKADSLKRASDFWNSYEKKVDSHHFATIKSMFTNKPESLKDHRGQVGSSDTHMHLIPDIRNYAKKVQDLITNDEDIKKRNFHGKPHIRVFRGVNGHYGKLIRDKANYNPHTNEADHTTLHIPTAHLTSWTTDPAMAARFAVGRGEIENQPKDQGLILSKWVPVESVLHSGFHDATLGHEHAHPSESEIVIGHPEGKFHVNTSEIHFQDPYQPEKFAHANEAPVDQEDKLAANEDDDLQYEMINKSLKNAIVPAATALALLGAPQDYRHEMPLSHSPAHNQQVTQPMPVQTIDSSKTEVASGLGPIRMIESSNGQNMAHKKIRTGMHAGTSAYGKFGLMPSTILETVKRSPSLSNKYHPLVGLDHKKDHLKVHQIMGTDPNMEVDIANSHWQRLRGIFGNDTDKMAYAWYNGISGAKKASDEEIKKHPYVQKYNKYRHMIDLENPDVKKSNPLDPSINIGRFIGFTNVEQNKKSVQDINNAIASNQLHNLSHSGKFTHDSFVAGFSPDNSWLIKIEPFGSRPSIESAKYGLQVIKEAAFYQVANKVFNLGNYTPNAILGEIEKDGKNWPAVAIRMYPKVYVSAHDMEESKPNSVRALLDKYRKTGDLHKMAAMLYILGDADAHGNNVMTDGYQVKLIDHGTSFANQDFDPSDDEKVFVPYILRAWGYQDKMDKADKIAHMPKIDNEVAQNELRHWINNLDSHDLLEILNGFEIDPRPSLIRLRMLQKMIQFQEPDQAINGLWIYGKKDGESNATDTRRHQANQ